MTTSTAPDAAARRKRSVKPDNSPLPGQAINTRPMAGDAIYERILSAIMEHRLTPGTKLVEEKLASIFGVNRTRVREVLARLSHEGLLTTIPNRGAFVASPTPDEARAIFAARRILEPALLRHLCEHTSPAHIEQLRAHVAQEAEARERGERRAIIRLSGEFHIRIADLVENPVMSKMMRELASLTCLIIVLYDSPTVPACTHDDHGTIIDAIEQGRTEEAVAAMIGHLHHIEQVLDMSTPPGEEEDLEEMLGMD
ncbi:GntR family transcriptional regulator [Herbaspirillum sp. YR522]|uniref:GntR family transcriptional regulator n=1 Tax=Herbaspirillum sp. YR522 TaxID=1144342 RepID=UPI00026FB3B4|nr:GntR family transcriptional regulator [Herbaspirillum sp. YR522]EJN02671.1 transcriptional regulator [Herbaspirillum sp. YR522]